MSAYFLEDPIENYDSDGGASYLNSQNVAYSQQPPIDYYEDDLELEYALSSPSPMNPYESSYNSQYHEGTSSRSGMHSRLPAELERLQRPSQESTYSRDNSRIGFGLGNSSIQNQRSRWTQSLNNSASANRYEPEEVVPSQSSRESPTSTPRNAHGIRLRPVSDLPDMYRSLFKFGVFNAVQSTCFDDVIAGDKNLVISAPTGSGKTVLFELAMVRALERSKAAGKQIKCVYVAPTKALCTEKFRDWAAKFEPLGFKCCELTGDTVVFGNSAWGEARNASIIVTTCEKWDSLTRNWHDHEHILSQVELFLVDEVHILNESRGSTLEVVTSRMKLRGPLVRFVLVSATVPNIEDVARWIGSGFGKSEPATVFEFGDDYRPCQLARHVVGVFRRNGTNEFVFAKSLDAKLFPTLQQYSTGKPILVFCATRNGVFDTAEHIKKEFIENEKKRITLPWRRPSMINHSFVDKRLDELASVGIGVHHAGLSMEDRRSTEQMFLQQVLRILVATSTLAVGVNLPAHMVVVKGVHTFQNGGWREFSDLDIMQMLGRAGRPQFDKDGVAVIMCETALEAKYRALAQGKTILESSLHNNLAEHLNSEIGLGTITSMESAKSWLHSSFLYQRMQRNPRHYAVSIEGSQGSLQDGDDLVLQSITQLTNTKLVEHFEFGKKAGTLSSTQYGDIMSKYYIRRVTMELILNLPEHSTLREILETICAAEEFQDCRLRGSEKGIFNELRKNNDIRFEVKKIEKTSDKVFLLVQGILGGISFNSPEYKSKDSQPHLEAFTVFKHIARIAKAALDVAIVKKDGAQVKHSLELVRCLSAKAWEDRAVVLRQIESIGEKSIKVLAENGVTSLALLRKQNPLRIETLLNRRAPFGLEVLSSLAEFPQYILKVKELDVHTDGGKSPVQVDLLVECSLVEEKAVTLKAKKSRNRGFNTTAVLTLTSDMDFVDLRRIPTKALKGGKSFEISVELTKPSQSVTIMITPETMAGMSLHEVYKPIIPPSEYPVLNTRPISSTEMDLLGLEDDPDFWNMTLDSGSPPEIKPELETSTPAAPKESVRDKPAASSSKAPLQNAEPTIRPGGRYECNHPCKDKTQCRHLCCREGLPEPRHASKKKAQTIHDAPEPTAKQPSKVQRLHTPAKSAAQAKEERTLKQLDNLHESTRISKNPNIQRLKLESPKAAKRKRTMPLEYDISFTDLKDPGTMSSYDIPDTFSDDEDLPEAILPLTSTPKDFRSPRVKKNAGPAPVSTRGEDENTFRPRKRIRRDPSASPVVTSPPRRQAGLFLSESSDSEGSVEIISPMTPKKRAPRTWNESSKEPSESIIMESPKMFSERKADLSSGNTKRDEDQDISQEAVRNEGEVDELAELDAWLQSGGVEIV